jgi:hypothetical protein
MPGTARPRAALQAQAALRALARSGEPEMLRTPWRFSGRRSLSTIQEIESPVSRRVPRAIPPTERRLTRKRVRSLNATIREFSSW